MNVDANIQVTLPTTEKAKVAILDMKGKQPIWVYEGMLEQDESYQFLVKMYHP